MSFDGFVINLRFIVVLEIVIMAGPLRYSLELIKKLGLKMNFLVQKLKRVS